MSFILKLSTVLFVCFFVMACNQSGENEAGSNQNAINTNTSITPLIVPDPGQTASTTQTIYDIWVLDSLNNKAPDSNYFSHGTPYFDFNLDKKTFSGHTGCNGINGKLSEVNGKLVFDSLQFSTEVCKDKGFEKKLLKAFKSGVTYTILNDRLHMNIDPTTVYIFRKIRR